MLSAKASRAAGFGGLVDSPDFVRDRTQKQPVSPFVAAVAAAATEQAAQLMLGIPRAAK